MRTRFLRGTTNENNGLTLAGGELAIDSEKKAVRLHDGVTPGGFEIIGTPIDFPPPGPTTLSEGDTTAGFYGEVPSSELIQPTDLSQRLGISEGNIINEDETLTWLKFSFQGKTIYIVKRPIRSHISWQAIYQAGAVYGDDTNGISPSGTARLQDAVVTIGSNIYRVRLLSGVNQDPYDTGADGLWNGYNVELTHGSEWNRLMYPIHSGVHNDTNNPTPHTDPSAAAYGSWASYSDVDLGTLSGSNNGSFGWCKEARGTTRAQRGGYGITYLYSMSATSNLGNRGWRPVLELVE